MNTLKEIREKAVFTLLNTNSEDLVHSMQVAKLAGEIFDKTHGTLHHYDDQAREWLRYGALLHDIGYTISANKHHKHAFSIIMQSSMEGFIDEDRIIIANIARYHRGSIPKDKHDGFKLLKDRQTRELVNSLSAFLRIGDGLDRSHTSNINSMDILIDQEMRKTTFILHPRSLYCSTELYGANKKKELFEKTFRTQAEFKIQAL